MNTKPLPVDQTQYPPRWGHDPAELAKAFELLGPYSWDVHTCDDGYVCRIFSAPEKGDELIAKAAAWSIDGAIRAALRKIGRELPE